MKIVNLFFPNIIILSLLRISLQLPQSFASEPASNDQFLPSEPFVLVDDIQFQGLNRTDPLWIRQYINTPTPIKMTRKDALGIARKLMTTGIFSDIKINFRTPSSWTGSKDDSVILEILVEEKWTSIPVLRAAFGGGTPLRVMGAYDTHVNGRLLTFGGEFRQYGDAPPGFVAFFRNPRSNGGKEYRGLELWDDRRIRDKYNDNREIEGQLKIHSQKIKLRYLAEPFADSQWLLPTKMASNPSQFKLGIETKIIHLFPTTYRKSTTNTSQEDGPFQHEDHSSYLFDALPSVVFDSIETGILDLEGLRIRYLFGPSLHDVRLGTSQEFEMFFYKIFPFEVNAASHFFIKSNSASLSATDQFIGGFDSIRGFPDGYRYGPSSYFANFELRKVILRSKYLWVQSLGFVDWGDAISQWSSLNKSKPLASTGVGFRLAIPQIYRLMFRIDYAWSITERYQGLSGGMNQFFDPFSPL